MQGRVKRAAVLVVVLASFAGTVVAQDWDRGVSLYNQKQYRQAIKEFHAVLKANPDAWKSWYYIGASHFQLQGYEDSIDAFQNYLKAAGKDEEAQAPAYYFIGFSYYQLKQYDKAIPALQSYITLSDKTKQKVDPTVRAALGRSYIFSNRFTEAIPVLTAAAAEMKTNATNYYYIGFAHQKLGRTDQAIAAFNQALTIDPKDIDTLTTLTELYLSQTRQNPAAAKQAMSVGERLMALKNDERAWGLLGQAYLIDQQYAKAAPLLDKYARAHPDSGSAWFNLGLAYSRSSQWKQAEDALEQATKLTPTSLPALLEMGYVYESDKQNDKALAAYERAYELSGRKDATAKAGIDRVKPAKP